jgi:hypothetical protein
VRHSSGIACIVFLLASGICAQGARAGSGGSTYSILGIGDLRYAPSVRSAGMGYAGIGLVSPSYINSIAPATWTGINRTRLEGAFQYEGFNSTDGASSRFLARADFYGALLAVPLSASNGIVLVTVFTPYSNVNYDTYIRGTYDTTQYTVHHVGSGAVTKGQIGLSYAPLPTLSVGVSLDYLFGTLEKTKTLASGASAFAGGTATENKSIRGLTVTIGGLYSGFGTWSDALKPLTLGFTLTTRGTLSSNSQGTYSYLYTNERDTTGETSGTYAIPLSFGIGASWLANERLVLAADVFTQPWRTADDNGQTPPGVRNTTRVGVGVERIPAREINASWAARVALRLGFFYNASYYTLNNTGINEWGVTGGLGLPLSGETRMNLALEYGSRGTTGNGLIRDKILRMSLSLNIAETWFVRYEEE